MAILAPCYSAEAMLVFTLQRIKVVVLQYQVITHDCYRKRSLAGTMDDHSISHYAFCFLSLIRYRPGWSSLPHCDHECPTFLEVDAVNALALLPFVLMWASMFS